MLFTDIIVILVSSAIFLAVITYLAVNYDNRKQLIGAAFFLSALAGLVLYGYSHAVNDTSIPVAIVCTVIDVGRMFAGVNNVEIFINAVGNNNALLFIFWSGHFLAYYTTASAAMLFIGSGLLRHIRRLFLRINDVDLIYGINENSIDFGLSLYGHSSKRRSSLVYVGSATEEGVNLIRHMGALIYSDSHAIEPDDRFLKRLVLKPGISRLNLYAISSDHNDNYSYSVKMLKALESSGISPYQTALTVIGKKETSGEELLSGENLYGYGTVRAFESEELAARLQVRKYPLCNAISFDDNARAQNDMFILLAGFNRTGQQVLRQLISNGQFEGSHFHAAVFDRDIADNNGFFLSQYPNLLKEYDITFHPFSAGSKEYCDFITDNATKLNYIVIANEDEGIARELSIDTIDLLYMNSKNLPVYNCRKNGITAYRKDRPTEQWSLYDNDILYESKMDELAIQINHFYCMNKGDAMENWKKLDYFSRMSSRSSADYLLPLIRRTGSDSYEGLNKEKAENLARSEHLHWMAFHYTMGYTKMDKNTLDSRIAMHKKDRSIRITRDPKSKKHACLVPWERLDILSSYISKASGEVTDYKQMDRKNVKVVIRLGSS